MILFVCEEFCWEGHCTAHNFSQRAYSWFGKREKKADVFWEGLVFDILRCSSFIVFHIFSPATPFIVSFPFRLPTSHLSSGFSLSYKI